MDRISAIFFAASLLLLLVKLPAAAQQAERTGSQSSGSLVLKDGVDINLKFAEDISSKSVAVDDPVTLTLDDDLRVGDVVVVKAGAKAYAIVSNVKKAGLFGKGAELNIRMDYLKADSAKIKLRGTKSREGEDKTNKALVLTILLGPVGVFTHGKEIEIKAGTALKAFVADDIILAPAP